MTVSVRRMETRDVAAVVRVHLRSFPGFFLSFLGPSFLRQLYLGIVEDPSGIAFVTDSTDGDTVVGVGGFVAGTDQPEGFYRRLLQRRWWHFGLASAVPALRRPRIVPRLLRALTMPRRSGEHGADSALLMSIAVEPAGQGTGAGAALVEAFLDEARRRGRERVVLTTDAADNDAVNRFYLQRGFSIVRTLATPEGRQMNEYAISLHPESSLPERLTR